MMTIEKIMSHLNHRIAEEFLRGDREALRRTQLAIGVLMDAAQSANDEEAFKQLRSIAAEAANKQEQAQGED